MRSPPKLKELKALRTNPKVRKATIIASARSERDRRNFRTTPRTQLGAPGRKLYTSCGVRNADKHGTFSSKVDQLSLRHKKATKVKVNSRSDIKSKRKKRKKPQTTDSSKTISRIRTNINRPSTSQGKPNFGSSPYERGAPRQIQTANLKERTRNHKDSFNDIYQDFKNATPTQIPLTNLFESSPSSTSINGNGSPSDHHLIDNQTLMTRRPHTSADMILSNYTFGTFVGQGQRASSAPLTRMVCRKLRPPAQSEKDNRPPTRQKPPPEALHLDSSTPGERV